MTLISTKDGVAVDTTNRFPVSSSLESGISVNNNSQLRTTRYTSQGYEQVDKKTAFGEQAVAELSPILQSSFEYTVDNTELFRNTSTGSGSVTQADAMAVISTGTTTGSTAHLRSRRPFKYRAGQGGLVKFTALLTAGVAGTQTWHGSFDTPGSSATFKNGYGIGYSGSDFAIVRFQNDTAFVTTQSNFSEDTLDGNGPSGMTIDPTKLNVFSIRFQYLGAGEVTYSIEDPATGLLFPFHKIKYANADTSPTIHNPNFFFYIYTENGATTSDIIAKSGSFAAFVEGKTRYREVHQPHFSSGTVQKTGVTTETALLTIRNKTTYAGKTNFLATVLEAVGASVNASAANNSAKVRVVRDATLGGTPSYSDINTSDSTMEIDTAGTTVTGGVEILSLQLSGQNDRIFEKIESLRILLDAGETVTIAVSSNNSATFNGSLLWRELQ